MDIFFIIFEVYGIPPNTIQWKQIKMIQTSSIFLCFLFQCFFTPVFQEVDITLGSKEWFDLDLWTCELKIYRDLLIEGNPCTKFGIDKVKGSKDIKRTTLGRQTDRKTHRHTDRPTVAQQHAPCFNGGINICMSY